MPTRRDFLKIPGGVLGTVALASSCGGGGSPAPGTTPIPHSYQFSGLAA